MNIRKHAVRLSLLSSVAAIFCLTPGCRQSESCSADDAPQAANATAEPAQPQAQSQVDSRADDPSWKTATEEVAVIRLGEKGHGGNLHNFCLYTNGNVLACWGARQAAPDDPTAAIKVYSPDGKLLTTWPLPSTPEAITVDADGTIYVGGAGRLLKLDSNGKILAGVDSPIRGIAITLDKPAMESLVGKSLSDQDFAMYKHGMEARKLAITGMAVTGDDVYAACPSPSDFAYRVYRFDRQLQNAKLIIPALHGCCGQMDLQAKDGKVWVPHNGRHLVESYDREGKKLFSFGKTDRKAADGFGGCCGPKNLRLASDGNIYAAESGPPACIKCFSQEGKFGGVTALPKFHTDCVRVSVDVTGDCKRFYILNTEDDAIHVMEKKS